MYNTLIKRDLWSIDRRKEAMGKINPILNKLVDAVVTHTHTNYPEDLDTDIEQAIRKYVEADVWDSCAMIVLNVLPAENKELYNLLLFAYDSYKSDYIHDYLVYVIFRGDLPETCRLEYKESYEEVSSDDFIVKRGKVMKKETTVNIICEEQSMLRLPQQADA